MDRETRAVLDELVGRTPPDLATLDARHGEFFDALTDAWLDGRIPGAADGDDDPLEEALMWMETAEHDQQVRDRAAFLAERAGQRPAA